jgi:nucleoside-diphosphate-sugar epimerase
MATLVTGAFGCIGSWVVLDDTRYQRELGPAPPTALVDGVRRTLDEFARLHKDGRLDARELG